MTIKIEAFQAKGIKTNEVMDKYRFCCWEALYDWLSKHHELWKCPDCKKK